MKGNNTHQDARHEVLRSYAIQTSRQSLFHNNLANRFSLLVKNSKLPSLIFSTYSADKRITRNHKVRVNYNLVNAAKQ